MKGATKIITVITVSFPWPYAISGTISCYIMLYHVISPLRFSQFPKQPAPHLSTGSIRLKDAVDLLDVGPRAVGKLPSKKSAAVKAGRWEKLWLENHGWWYHPPCYKLVSLDSKPHEYPHKLVSLQ